MGTFEIEPFPVMPCKFLCRESKGKRVGNVARVALGVLLREWSSPEATDNDPTFIRHSKSDDKKIK